MADETLTQLLVPQTVAQIFDQLIALATSLGFPTSSWQEGGTERGRLMLFATVLSDVITNYVPGATSGGLAKLSTGLWLDLLAPNNYNISRQPASQTDGYITFDTTVSGAGPYNGIVAQSFFIVFPDGLRYYNVNDFSIPGNGTVSDVLFRSEFPVDSLKGLTYSEGSLQAITMLNPLPGVAVTNPEQPFSAVVQNGLGTNGAGVGTGVITPSGVAVAKYFVIIRIDQSGDSSSAVFSYSLDGNVFQTGFSGPTLLLLDGVTSTGITITLTNGTSVPTFAAGDTYTFSTTRSWIVVQGADAETDTSLQNRCIDAWNLQSNIPTGGFYERLALQTPGVGSQVTQVIVQPDGYVNDKVNIVIAGPNGALGENVIAQVQNYISPRSYTIGNPVVISPGVLNVGVTATITVTIDGYGALFGTTGFDGLVGDVLNDVINRTQINGTIYLSTLIEKIKELANVIDVGVGIELNGDNDNLPLGTTTTFQLASFDSGTSALTWVKK